MKRLIMRAATTVALLGALVAPAALSGPAVAVPDTGAGGDTPGTTATVTTRSVPVGGTIGFRVTGFPAGEVVYVKIDDGRFCSSSATHGACVVHQQRLDAGGAANGSFALPSDVAVGKHWLRFLASQEVAGSGGGVKGYTARGTTDFTVTAATSSGASDKASDTATTSGTTSDAPAAGATSSAAGSSASTAAAPVVPSAGATLHVGPPKPAATVTVTATPSPPADTSVDPGADDLAAASATKSGHPPYVGIAGLIALLALAALLIARRVRRAGD